MTIHKITNDVCNSNTYIVHSGHDSIILDPGNAESIFRYVKDHDLRVMAIFLTHTHYDHIYGLPKMLEMFPSVPVYTSTFGKHALVNSKWNLSRYFQDEISITEADIRVLHDGDSIRITGDLDFKVLETPGHDKSCLTFRLKDNLFTGDSYIPGEKVVCTFPQSDKDKARKWHDELEEMGKNLNILPGHGYGLNMTILS